MIESLNVKQMPAPEKFEGATCSSCKEDIYGDGFRLILVMTQSVDPLPTFKETEIKLCSSCKVLWLGD